MCFGAHLSCQHKMLNRFHPEASVAVGTSGRRQTALSVMLTGHSALFYPLCCLSGQWNKRRAVHSRRSGEYRSNPLLLLVIPALTVCPRCSTVIPTVGFTFICVGTGRNDLHTRLRGLIFFRFLPPCYHFFLFSKQLRTIFTYSKYPS